MDEVRQRESAVAGQSPSQEQQALRVLEVLSSLNYRSGNLQTYLSEITIGLSRLLTLDWTVVTLCQSGFERVMASSIPFDGTDQLYSLHGSLTNTVVEKRCSLAVADARQTSEFGEPPEGYLSYLGVPLRTSQNEVMGTICSFNMNPRAFSADEVRIAELFAERAATAIENYRLYEKQLQFNESLEQQVAARTQELQEAQAKLVEQERLAAIGEFAAMIVHEIRNPLTSVMMGLKSFKRLELTPPFQERLSLAEGEAERLHRLLSEILLFAKPQTLQSTELNLNAFIAASLPQLCEMPEAQDRQILFSPAAQVVRILADGDRLKQVLINLVRNACEAIPTGETVHCAVEVIDQEVAVHIQNGGEPIPPELLARLTQPFCSSKPGGTGLGLAIVKRIVEAHNGTLLIQSTAQIGTIVTVQFPILA